MIVLILLIALQSCATCLRIRREALDLSMNTNKPQFKAIIGELLVNGPYNLLGELLNLQSIDLKPFAEAKCSEMTIYNVLDVMRGYELGAISRFQYEAILSADCMAQWSKDVFKHLNQIKAIPLLPKNILESRDVDANKIEPGVFMMMLNSAWEMQDDDRAKINWYRWTEKLLYGPTKLIFNHKFWNERNSGISPNLWQSVTGMNVLFISETQYINRKYMVDFIGLAQRVLDDIALTELVHRVYTLLSFMTICEIDCFWLKTKTNQTAVEFRAGLELKDILMVTVKRTERLLERIKEIDEESHDNLRYLCHFINKPPTDEASTVEQVNAIFEVFLASIQSIGLGDWMIGIVCILMDNLEVVKPENMIRYLDEFLARRPSTDALVFLYLALTKKFDKDSRVLAEFSDRMQRLPNYLLEMYRTNRRTMPVELILAVPLRVRVLENYKNRIVVSRNRAILKFLYLNDPEISDLRKFVEMMQVIGTFKLHLNQPAKCLVSESEFENINLKDVLVMYFQLFLKQKEFYEVIKEDLDGRPVVRLLPVFPVSMWGQMAHLITLANLLTLPIPFVLDFPFFKAILNEKSSEIESEMSANIESEATESQRKLYDYLWENVWMPPNQLINWYIKVKDWIQVGSVAARFRRRRASSELTIRLRPFEQSMHVCGLVAYGMQSFAADLKHRMNVEEFTVEEAFKLIFYSAKQ